MHCSANRSPFSHDPATLLDGSAEFFLETNAFFCIDDSIVIFEPSSIVFRTFWVAVEGTAFCDFDSDGSCGIADINDLIVQTTLDFPDPRYDIDQDGDVSITDVDTWLQEAAAANGLSLPYFRGDANLDGYVDAYDFIAWNEHKFSNSLRWDFGDMNTDLVIDGADFMIWNANKFTSSHDPPAVPEPTSGIWTIVLFSLVERRAVRCCRHRSDDDL